MVVVNGTTLAYYYFGSMSVLRLKLYHRDRCTTGLACIINFKAMDVRICEAPRCLSHQAHPFVPSRMQGTQDKLELSM